MVFILDGTLEIGAHVMLCYLIDCLRHSIVSRAVTNPIRFHSCALCSMLLSNIGPRGLGNQEMH